MKFLKMIGIGVVIGATFCLAAREKSNSETYLFGQTSDGRSLVTPIRPLRLAIELEKGPVVPLGVARECYLADRLLRGWVEGEAATVNVIVLVCGKTQYRVLGVIYQ